MGICLFINLDKLIYGCEMVYFGSYEVRISSYPSSRTGKIGDYGETPLVLVSK